MSLGLESDCGVLRAPPQAQGKKFI
jgi:hypothetical protein